MSVADDYARGSVPFMGLQLLVAPGALVPRPETELLGHTALALLRDLGRPALAIDMCCGAGNLACALAAALPDLRVFASDLTPECTALAQRNVDHHRLGDRVAVHRGDLFAPLQGLDLHGRVDAVVCNPPYISDQRLLGDRSELLQHEPREAFAAGPYGLGIHQRVIKDALPFLRPGGWLLFEFGHGQGRQVQLLFQRARAYGPVRLVADSEGAERVALAQKHDPTTPSPQ